MDANHAALDILIANSLTQFAESVLATPWPGKEHDWVSRYVFGHLINECSPSGPLKSPAQIAVEVGVAQPPGRPKLAANRDVVIWSDKHGTAWDANWRPTHQPLAIIEWKVHRADRRNRSQPKERQWLRDYTNWQHAPVAYAVEVTLLPDTSSLTCARFHAGTEHSEWVSISRP